MKRPITPGVWAGMAVLTVAPMWSQDEQYIPSAAHTPDIVAETVQALTATPLARLASGGRGVGAGRSDLWQCHPI